MRRTIACLLIGLLLMFVFVLMPSCQKAEEGVDKAASVAEQMKGGTVTDETIAELEEDGEE